MNASSNFLPGNLVQLVDSDYIGEVVAVTGHKVTIKFAYMTMTVPRSQVKKISAIEQANVSLQNNTRAPIRLLNITRADAAQFNTTIDLHGMTVQEALHALDQWLDKAVLLGHHHLKVIHGIGEGILRKAIRAYLHKHALVKKVVEQHPYLGASGVTGVEL